MGHVLDVPLGHKDAAYVRSHFDGMEVRINDAPRADEIMVLDTGRVAERGPTAALAADPDSRYAQLLAVGTTVAVDEVVS